MNIEHSTSNVQRTLTPALSRSTGRGGKLPVCMRRMLSVIGMIVLSGSVLRAEVKPVPRIQVVPQPYQQISFQREGVEIARYHFGSALRRPFVFRLIVPA